MISTTLSARASLTASHISNGDVATSAFKLTSVGHVRLDRMDIVTSVELQSGLRRAGKMNLVLEEKQARVNVLSCHVLLFGRSSTFVLSLGTIYILPKAMRRNLVRTTLSSTATTSLKGPTSSQSTASPSGVNSAARSDSKLRQPSQLRLNQKKNSKLRKRTLRERLVKLEFGTLDRRK